MKLQDKVGTIILIVALCCGVFILIKSRIDNFKIQQNNQSALGQIDEFGIFRGRSGSSGEFWFIINGTTYSAPFPKESECKNLTSEDKKYIMSFSIPIVYYPPNPYNAKILLRKEDYARFNVSYPDGTLGKMLDTYFNCD